MNEVVRSSLEIMGKGMFSVFLVLLILAVIVMLLSKITGSKKNNEPDNE